VLVRRSGDAGPRLAACTPHRTTGAQEVAKGDVQDAHRKGGPGSTPPATAPASEVRRVHHRGSVNGSPRRASMAQWLSKVTLRVPSTELQVHVPVDVATDGAQADEGRDGHVLGHTSAQVRPLRTAHHRRVSTMLRAALAGESLSPPSNEKKRSMLQRWNSKACMCTASKGSVGAPDAASRSHCGSRSHSEPMVPAAAPSPAEARHRLSCANLESRLHHSPDSAEGAKARATKRAQLIEERVISEYRLRQNWRLTKGSTPGLKAEIAKNKATQEAKQRLHDHEVQEAHRLAEQGRIEELLAASTAGSARDSSRTLVAGQRASSSLCRVGSVLLGSIPADSAVSQV